MSTNKSGHKTLAITGIPENLTVISDEYVTGTAPTPGESINPFGAVLVTDSNPNALITAKLSAGGNGYFTNVPSGDPLNGPAYITSSMTPAELTAYLRSVTLSPGAIGAPNDTGSLATILLDLSASDGTTTVGGGTDVTEVPPSQTAQDQIAITGTANPTTVQDDVYSGSGIPMGGATVHPFKTLTVIDTDPNILLTAQFMSRGNGSISSDDLTEIMSTADGPAYYTTAAVTPAALTQILQNISVSAAPINSEPNRGEPNTTEVGYTIYEGQPTQQYGYTPPEDTPSATGFYTLTEIAKQSTPPSGKPTQPIAPVTPTPADNFNLDNTTTGAKSQSAGQTYTGPVAGLTSEYISPTQDSLNVTALVPNAFIVTGAGNDAVDVSAVNGNNVISSGTGNNFLTGGTGDDTFFVDERSTTAVWDTINGFHAGDGVTIWGMTPQQIFTWQDGQGATGYTGLTFHTSESAGPYASLTLVGYSQADLTSGKLSMAFGTDSSGNNYLYIQGH